MHSATDAARMVVIRIVICPIVWNITKICARTGFSNFLKLQWSVSIDVNKYEPNLPDNASSLVYVTMKNVKHTFSVNIMIQFFVEKIIFYVIWLVI